MKIHLASLGCARNQIDSEIMLGRLKKTGAVITDDPAEAEVIVVNTCSFIESAADESIGTILDLAKHKQQGVCRRLVVTGCLPERYREDISEAIPEVDVFLGTGAFGQIVEAVDGYLDTTKCILPDPDAISVSTPGAAQRVRNSPHMAYLKTAEGCDRHCTYCIIPKLRGRQKSRPLADILAEARQLIQSNVRELVLVSQETTAYGKDATTPVNFARLLESLAALAEEPVGRPSLSTDNRRFWIRFLYGHPESLNEKIIAAVAQHASICSYVDVPIQHASRSILKRMGRRYGPEDLHDMVDNIRRKISDVALRTTVIIGFPGETDKEFKELMDFVESAQFEHLGCFVYSDAEDLPSHSLPDHVPAAKARERYRHLMMRQQEISTKLNRRYRDRTLTVLVEQHPESGLYTGRTEFQAPEVDGMTYIHADNLQTGSFARVRITDTLEYDLVGVVA